MNPEARFKLELSEAQLEIQRLRERLSTTHDILLKRYKHWSECLKSAVNVLTALYRDRFLEISEYACLFTYILVETSAICTEDGPK